MKVEPYILLVGIGAEELPLSDDARGSFSGFTRYCPDIFRALARIGRDSSVRGVVVDVALVGSGQMEFFSLVGRVRRGLPVYVVASTSTVEPRCDEAISLGATGRFCDDAALSLVAACRVGSESAKSEEVEVATDEARCPSPIQESVAVEHPVVQQVDVTEVAATENRSAPVVSDEVSVESDDAAESASGDEASDSGPARVPWLRYTEVPGRKGPGGPRREPPKRGSPASDGLDSSDAGEHRDEHEPLLTNEELAALLDDDGLTDSPGERGAGEDDGGSGAVR